MNRWAVTAAVMGFFALAFVAWLGGCTTFRCAIRGLIGAGIVYVLVRFALKVLVNVIAETLAKTQMSPEEPTERPKR